MSSGIFIQYKIGHNNNGNSSSLDSPVFEQDNGDECEEL